MTLAPSRPHAEVGIDATMVSALLATQVPESAGMHLGERHEGRDAVMWRLGNDWAVRLPKRQLAADRQATEAEWLPRIAQSWPFRAPVPVRVGSPSGSYPWRWTIVPWVQGHPSAAEPLSTNGASQLGAALAALHTAAPAQAPRHPRRSRPLVVRGARFEDRLATLVRRTAGTAWNLSADAAGRIFEHGSTVPRPAAVWCHLDLRAQHVLTQGGALAGIIDWGDASAGDAAADIGQALIAVPPTHWDALVEGLGGLDMPTFARARAEAVDFAASLALSSDRTDVAKGWMGLQALGVAHHNR